MADNLLYFIFLFSIDKVRRWHREVLAVDFIFMIGVTILSFPTLFISRLTSVSSHRSPECPPPKHSFLSMCCAWFPYPVSTCLLWMSFFYTCLPQRRLFPSIAPPKPSVYIHHSSYTTNTAWSVHYIVSYLRRPHYMYSP